MKPRFKVRSWFKGVEVEKKLHTKKEVEELVEKLHQAAKLLGFPRDSVKIEIVELN